MNLKRLEKKLGYEFKKKELLIEALTHKSYTYETGGGIGYDNEKLEFLGDSILNLVISDIIYKKNPDFSEGGLSKLRASLINEYTLAGISVKLDIGKFLLLGKGEERSGGRKKSSLLSNAYEAILAAVYLDGGFRAASNVIKRHFKDSFTKTSLKKLDRDYKSQVQEKSHKIFKATPKYRVVKKSGPEHRQKFEVELIIDKKAISKGTGSSKKEAEQKAAKKALGILKKCDTK